jgi:CheY-like chemotaxis protein/DNA-binding phage protein
MKKILIVEDEPVIASVYSKRFTRCGFLVEVAQDGDEGLQKIAAWNPDLVLLDVMLPKVNGLDLLRSIRSHETTRSLPVIVYSNAFTVSVAEEARQLGASHLMSKSDTRPNQVIELASALLKSDVTESRRALVHDSESYVINARQTATQMRKLLSDCLRQNDSDLLADLRHKTRVVGAMAWLADIHRVARLAEGLEAFLRTLCENPQYITFSTDKTVLHTVECLAELMEHADDSRAAIDSSSVLIVDDQEICLLAAQSAMKSARLASTCIADPEQAVELLGKSWFDLVLLDIEMPKMDGVSLCAHLRSMPHHRSTPVVFFSQLSEVGYRLESMTAGGNDFIGKPFLKIELAVKALTWIVKPKAPSV